MYGALYKRNHNFNLVKIYREGTSVSAISPFPNLPERIRGGGGRTGQAGVRWWDRRECPHGPRLEGVATIFDQKRHDRPSGHAQGIGAQETQKQTMSARRIK